jgi:hypothetical protein
MSVIDELRQLLQDLVSPEFRALSARVEMLEQRVDRGFDDLRQLIQVNEARAAERHTTLITTLELDQRVKTLEQGRLHQPPTEGRSGSRR